MSESREESPDWLRAFQAPTKRFVTLSSDSESSPEITPKRSDHSNHQQPEIDQEEPDSVFIDSGEEESPLTKGKKPKTLKSEKKPKALKAEKEGALDSHLEGPAEEDARDKPAGHPVSSRLPLVFPDKVQRSKALVECDGDSIDLSGDVGAVGRVVVSNGPSGNHQMLLDLKGTIYKSTIIPSRTFCIVSVGQSEAKVEAIMNDFIQLEPQSNVFEAETMIEGTLDGFSFDSDEDTEKMPKPPSNHEDQNNENGDEENTRKKVKVDKGLVSKKPKAAGKPLKKGARKPQVVKKSKKSRK